MRAAITVVGPLTSRIQSTAGLGEAMAGILTTIPLLMYAAGAAVVRKCANKYGPWETMLGGLVVLSVGLVVRSLGTVAGLLIGAVLVGLGISGLNILLPALIKACYPNSIGAMTGAYSLGMSVSAALGAAAAVPLAVKAGYGGWPFALRVWVVISVITAIAWATQKNALPDSLFGNPSAAVGTTSIYKSKKAWAVALFMGLQSMLFYVFVAWLSPIVMARGFNEATAGFMSSLFQVVTIPASFITPILAGKIRNSIRFSQFICGIYIAALLLLNLGRSFPIMVIAIVLCSYCSGSVVSLAFSFISRSAATASSAIQLSSMAQCIGYIIAAVGPFLLGRFFEIYGSWQIAFFAILIIAVCLFAVSGPAAGNEKV